MHVNLSGDKSLKLSKIGFSVKCFRPDVLQFSSLAVKTFILGGKLALAFNSKYFRRFLKFPYFLIPQAFKTFGNS